MQMLVAERHVATGLSPAKFTPVLGEIQDVSGLGARKGDGMDLVAFTLIDGPKLRA